MRNTSAVSKDINGDTIIEVPIVNLMQDMWRGKVTTKTDTATRRITLYEWIAKPKSASGALD